jgi:hypothetical protein
MKNNPLIIAAATLVIGATAGFFGGMKYQQSKTPARGQFFAGQFGGTGGRGGQPGTNGGNRAGNRPVAGDIISADDKSITVKLQDGSTKIVLVTDSTVINKADKAAKTDLKTGQTVAVFGQTNPDGSVTAQNIQLNPEIRVFGNGPRPSGSPMPQ